MNRGTRQLVYGICLVLLGLALRVNAPSVNASPQLIIAITLIIVGLITGALGANQPDRSRRALAPSNFQPLQR